MARQRKHVHLRGELCIGAATALSFISVLLLIFAHVGQLSTATVPRGIAMVKVNMSLYSQALQVAIGDPVEGLYNTSPQAPLEEQAGLRQEYRFGLYSHCAYVDETHGRCSNSSVAKQFAPYSAVLADMPQNYSDLTLGFIPGDLTFVNSHYLAEFSRAAYYMLLMGSISATLAMLVGIPKRTYTFLASTVLAILASVLLFIGVVIWTVIINKAQGINNSLFVPLRSTTSVPLGITVSVGAGLWLFWAAFVCIFISVAPYLVSTCTYRG